MPYHLSTDRSHMQVDRIHAWLAATYWSPNIRREVLETAIANSIVVGAFDDATGEQVAYARAVTDCATFAWLCDVYVDPGHRQRGIAKRMIEELERHPRLQTLRRWCLATQDAHALYKQLGYTTIPVDRWMEKRLPVSAWQANG
jgi:GNAT superfamily N-acetyltransferase